MGWLIISQRLQRACLNVLWNETEAKQIKWSTEYCIDIDGIKGCMWRCNAGVPLCVMCKWMSVTKSNKENPDSLYSVDLEVWSKLSKRTRIKRIASKFARDFDWNWQRVNVFSHCVILWCVLLTQIISLYSVTKVSVLVVLEYKCKSVIYVYELVFFTPYFKVNRV